MSTGSLRLQDPHIIVLQKTVLPPGRVAAALLAGAALAPRLLLWRRRCRRRGAFHLARPPQLALDKAGGWGWTWMEFVCCEVVLGFSLLDFYLPVFRALTDMSQEPA